VINGARTLYRMILQSINQAPFFVRPKVDQRAGKFSLRHTGITKSEKMAQKLDTLDMRDYI